jgi:hypothetical protein
MALRLSRAREAAAQPGLSGSSRCVPPGPGTARQARARPGGLPVPIIATSPEPMATARLGQMVTLSGPRRLAEQPLRRRSRTVLAAAEPGPASAAAIYRLSGSPARAPGAGLGVTVTSHGHESGSVTECPGRQGGAGPRAAGGPRSRSVDSPA